MRVKRGKVYLIGAGPGDPELITLRGVRALGLADVVLYDALAHPALLRHARVGAELRSVGKRYGEDSFSQDAINAELVELASAGKVVARTLEKRTCGPKDLDQYRVHTRRRPSLTGRVASRDRPILWSEHHV